MATSGSIGNTLIETAKVIDHAVRRCGLSPSTLTPEQLEIAQDNLFFVTQALYNRGINLWCIDRVNIGLNPDRTRYDLPPGTVDILSARYRYGNALQTATQAVLADQARATFSVPVAVKTVGIYFGSTLQYTLVIEISNDGVTWTPAKYIPQFIGYSGQWAWIDIDPAYATAYFRIRETVLDTTIYPVQFAQVVLMNATTSTEIAKMSRDTYDSLPNKTSPGRPLQFLFDKLVDPQVVFWPTPNDSFSFVEFTRQRQVMDIGGLQDSLEIPNRWYEAAIWTLAKLLAFELPQVPKERFEMCIALSETSMREAEDGETDGSPIFVQPQISGYTK